MARSAVSGRQLLRDMGTCLRFDGSTGYIVKNSQLFFQNTGYSVSFWIKAKPTNARILALGNSGSANQVWSLENNGSNRGIAFFLRNDSNTIVKSSTFGNITVFDAIWHHICFTDNNGAAKLYVDGVQDSQDFTYTRSGAFTFDRTAFGALVRNTVGSFFNGQGDDIVIYNNTVLTSVQVSDIHIGIDELTGITTRWKFDEGSGTTATDSSASGNTGTLTGAVTYSSDVAFKPRIATSGRVTVSGRIAV
jgi:hypothetical protein